MDTNGAGAHKYRVIIASGNKGKASEIAEEFRAPGCPVRGFEVLTIRDAAGRVPDAEENGATLRENALIKANAAYGALRNANAVLHKKQHSINSIDNSINNETACSKNSDVLDIIIADDSGLFVDALDSRPGVHSARYAGDGATDSDRNEKLLRELNGASESRRSAQFRCVFAIRYPSGLVEYAEGECSGEIALEPKGANGFGYDPLFFLPDKGQTMAELSQREKNMISHRGKAVRNMAALIYKYIGESRLDAEQAQ